MQNFAKIDPGFWSRSHTNSQTTFSLSLRKGKSLALLAHHIKQSTSEKWSVTLFNSHSQTRRYQKSEWPSRPRDYLCSVLGRFRVYSTIESMMYIQWSSRDAYAQFEMCPKTSYEYLMYCICLTKAIAVSCDKVVAAMCLSQYGFCQKITGPGLQQWKPQLPTWNYCEIPLGRVYIKKRTIVQCVRGATGRPGLHTRVGVSANPTTCFLLTTIWAKSDFQIATCTLPVERSPAVSPLQNPPTVDKRWVWPW